MLYAISMNIRIVVLLVLMIICVSLNAVAQKHIDNRDTTGIMSIINQGLAYRQHNKDSALVLLFKGLATSRKLNYTDGILKAMYSMGLTYNTWAMYDSSIKWNTAAITYGKQSIKYKHLTAALYSNIGYAYYIKGNYSQAINYFDSSVKEGLKLNLPTERAHLAITLNNLSGIHQTLNQNKEALEYLNQAEEICRKGNFHEQLALTLRNKGAIYSNMEQDKETEYNYEEALKVATQYKIDEYIHSSKVGLASLRLKQKRPEEALKLLEEIDLKSNTHYKEYNFILPTYLKGRAYLQLGKFSLAESYLKNALKESLDAGIRNSLLDIYGTLLQVYDSIGNYKKALEYFYIYEHLKDSLVGKEKARDINDIDIKYRTAEKELLISKQRSQLTQRNIWIGTTSVGALFLMGLLLFRSRINKQKQENQSKQIYILQQQHLLQSREQEITRLNAMMQGEEKERSRIARELHDGIGGMLASIKLNLNKIKKNEKEPLQITRLAEMESMLNSTTNEVRKTAHNLMPDALTRYGLEEALLLYCESINNSEELQIETQLYGNLATLDATIQLIIYRISQELIQNIIKHAHATHAMLQIWEHENKITIQAEDNGRGFDTSSIRESMGFQNLLHRVQHLQGTLDVDSVKDKYTTVHIEFSIEGLIK